MTNQQILEKAIQKAIDGGFDLTLVGGFYTKSQMKTKDFKWKVEKLGKGLATIWSYDLCISCGWTYYEGKQISSHITESMYRHMNFTTEQLIFNHDFAKALWPNPKNYNNFEGMKITISVTKIPLWQVHLQMMVIADDPIKYLGENL